MKKTEMNRRDFLKFSQTAVQYVVGGNFLFHGQEILFI